MRLLWFALVLWVCLVGASITSLLQDDASVYVLHGDSLTEIGVFSGQHETLPLPALPTENERRLWSAQMSDQTLYQIEAWGRSTNRRILNAPTGAELIAIDLATHTRERIFDRTTVFNIVPSPDGERMIVFYYAGEYLYSTQHACILDLQTRECLELGFDYLGRNGFWLDNDSFIVGTDNINPLRLINANDASSQTLYVPLEWYINWATPIPEQDALVMSVLPREITESNTPVSFMTYDLTTGETALLPYTVNELTVSDLELSPDGSYLMYRSENTVIVDFQTGEYIQEFTRVTAYTWIDDETFIVQRYENENTLEVIRLDVPSRQQTTLAEGDEASGFLLIP